MMKLNCRAVTVAFVGAALCSCAVGPDYHRPAFETTPSYKESADWKPTEPNDILSRGAWWKIYNDDALNSLEDRVNISNETIKAAAAAFEQSRALVAQARAGLWPTISAFFQATRGTQLGLPAARNSYSAGVSGSWDLDIWGGIRRTVESDRASAQSSSAALAAARLSAQSEVALDYFELRAADQNQKLLDTTVEAETQSLTITEDYREPLQIRRGRARRRGQRRGAAAVKSGTAGKCKNSTRRARTRHCGIDRPAARNFLVDA
jgi:outer membrane protein TolC